MHSQLTLVSYVNRRGVEDLFFWKSHAGLRERLPGKRNLYSGRPAFPDRTNLQRLLSLNKEPAPIDVLPMSKSHVNGWLTLISVWFAKLLVQVRIEKNLVEARLL